MREVILIFSYIICAFLPLVFLRRMGNLNSHRSFWGTWFVSLTGAFAGGAFGTMLLAKAGMDIGLFARVIPAFFGAWLLSYMFIKLRALPGNW